MNDTQVKVPMEMLGAANAAVVKAIQEGRLFIEVYDQNVIALQAALQWKKEHPTVPTDEQLIAVA